MQVCKYESIQVCKYASMQVCKYTSMQVCKYASMHIYASMQVCKYESMIELCTAQSNVQIDCMFALRHFLFIFWILNLMMKPNKHYDTTPPLYPSI